MALRLSGLHGFVVFVLFVVKGFSLRGFAPSREVFPGWRFAYPGYTVSWFSCFSWLKVFPFAASRETNPPRFPPRFARG